MSGAKSVRPLGDFAVQRGGSVDPSKFPGELFELYSIPAYDTGEPERLLGAEIGSSKKVVEAGDVLLSRIVPHIRRVWIVGEESGLRKIASSEWIVFRNEDLSGNYLRHFLLGDTFHYQFMQTVAGVGGSLLRARPEGTYRIEVPIPAPDEQRRIAAILDKADAIRRKRQQAIQLADDFLRSVFLDMFGDPSSNRHGYEIGTVRDLIAEVRYGTSTKANTLGQGIPVLRMNNITYAGSWNFDDLKHVELEDGELDKYTASPGDILFNRTNSKELVGKTAVYPDRKPMAFAGYLVRARTNELGNPYYISAYLNSEHGKKTLVGMCKSIVGMANINAQEFQNIPILLPPKALQDRFEKRCLAIQQSREKHEQSVKEAADLSVALSSQFFSQ